MRTWCALAALLLSACAAEQPLPRPLSSIDEHLWNRSTADLACDRLAAATLIARRTVQIAACGRSATYVQVCERGDGCVWLLNSPIH